jgi:hypothetical protein
MCASDCVSAYADRGVSAKVGVLQTIRMLQQEGRAEPYNLVSVDFIQVINEVTAVVLWTQRAAGLCQVAGVDVHDHARTVTPAQ